MKSSLRFLNDASITDRVGGANCLLERRALLHDNESISLGDAAALMILRSRFFDKNDGNIFWRYGNRGTLLVVTIIGVKRQIREHSTGLMIV